MNDPRDAENAALLNENISLGKRVKFAIQHPAVVRTMMDKNESALRNADSWYLADDAGNAVSSRSPLHTVLETIFGRDHHAISRWCLICAALLVLLLPIVRRQSASVMLCAFLLMVLLGTIGYLPLTLVLTGGIDLLTVKPLAFLLGDFNSEADVRGEGYDLILRSGWQDTYRLARQRDDGYTVVQAIDGWRDAPDAAAKKRIDQIWCSQAVPVHSSRVVFGGKQEPRVSDHAGVLIEVER